MYCSMSEVDGRQEDELLAVTPEAGISKPTEMQCVVDVPHTLASTSGVRGSRTGFRKTIVLLPCIGEREEHTMPCQSIINAALVHLHVLDAKSRLGLVGSCKYLCWGSETAYYMAYRGGDSCP